jgi:hypothetical protein
LFIRPDPPAIKKPVKIRNRGKNDRCHARSASKQAPTPITALNSQFGGTLKCDYDGD